MSYYEGEQRRAAPRIAIQIPISFIDTEGNRYSGTTFDLSNRGFGAILNDQLQAREDYAVEFSLPKSTDSLATPLPVHVFIVYCTPNTGSPSGFRTGGYFSQITEYERILLDKYLLHF